MYEDYEDYDLEPNRHRKIKKNTTPKTKKSNHKHSYVPCIFSVPYDFIGRERTVYYTGEYCEICGKISIGAVYNEMPNNAISIDNLWQKTIDLKNVS